MKKNIKLLSCLAFALLFATIKISLGQFVFEDQNLQDYLKYKLGLGPNDVITQDIADQLITIDASAMQLTSIVGIEHFRNLQHASFASNDLTDISPIAVLPKLYYVNFSNNEISDISPLVNTLAETLIVIISDNCVQDFSPLEENDILDIELIGADEQRAECPRTYTRIEEFRAYGKNYASKEIGFEYVAWSTETDQGFIDYGDGSGEPVLCDGFLNNASHSYDIFNNYTVTLEINGVSKQLDIGTLFIIPEPLQPTDYEEISSDFYNFQWDFFATPALFELEIYDDQNQKVYYYYGEGNNTHDVDLQFLEKDKTYSWRVRVHSEFGASFWSDEKYVRYFYIPAPPPEIFELTIDISLPDASDPDQEITFTGECSEEVQSWDWDFNNGQSTATGKTVKQRFCGSGEQTATLSVQRQNGETESISRTFYQPLNEKFSINIKDAVACSGSSVTFETEPFTCGGSVITDPITGGSGEYKINWYPKRGLKNTTKALPTLIKATRSTFYMIHVLDRKTGQLIKKRINVNVQRPPVVKMTRRVNAKKGDKIQLGKYARSMPKGGSFTFEWSDKKGWTSTEMNPEIEASASRRYYLTVNNESGCASREQSLYVRVSRHKEAFVDTVETQARELPAENPYECKVYPNPAKDYVNIELFFEETTSVKVLITNLVGKKYFELAESGNDTYMFTINVRDMQPGIYAVRIEAGDMVINERFIRE